MSSPLDECRDIDVVSPSAGQKDIYVQLVLSLVLGASSFIAFCVSSAAATLVEE